MRLIPLRAAEEWTLRARPLWSAWADLNAKEEGRPEEATHRETWTFRRSRRLKRASSGRRRDRQDDLERFSLEEAAMDPAAEEAGPILAADSCCGAGSRMPHRRRGRRRPAGSADLALRTSGSLRGGLGRPNHTHRRRTCSGTTGSGRASERPGGNAGASNRMRVTMSGGGAVTIYPRRQVGRSDLFGARRELLPACQSSPPAFSRLPIPTASPIAACSFEVFGPAGRSSPPRSRTVALHPRGTTASRASLRGAAAMRHGLRCASRLREMSPASLPAHAARTCW